MRPQSENKERLFGSSEDGRRSARESAVVSRKKIVEKLPLVESAHAGKGHAHRLELTEMRVTDESEKVSRRNI